MRTFAVPIVLLFLLAGCVQDADPGSVPSSSEPRIHRSDAPETETEGDDSKPQNKTYRGTITMVGFDFPNVSSEIVPGCGGLASTTVPEIQLELPGNITEMRVILTWDQPGETLFLSFTPPTGDVFTVHDEGEPLGDGRIQHVEASPKPGAWRVTPCAMGAAVQVEAEVTVEFV